jgi:phosphonate dehydrogenase
VLSGDAFMRSGSFTGWRPGSYSSGLAGAAVGVVGWGPLGAAIMQRVAAFGALIRDA